MGELSSYLSIAGLAHRQAAELRRAIADDPQHFPTGEQPFRAAEIAVCEAVIAAIQGILALHFRLLEFSQEGNARACVPRSLQEEGEEPPVLES